MYTGACGLSQTQYVSFRLILIQFYVVWASKLRENISILTDSFFNTSYRSLSIAVHVRAAWNKLQIATEHNELTRKGLRKQSKIFGIPVSLI